MALAMFALLSVLVIVDGFSITQWKNHSVNTGFDDSENSTCSNTWFFTKQFANGSTACECGSDLGLIISCDGATGKVELLEQHCMTYDTHNTSLVVGLCYFAYYRPVIHKEVRYQRYALPVNPSLLNQKCEEYDRTGQLCGKCKDGYVPPVYSYNLSCVGCTDYSYNWVKYIAAGFLPLTLFFLVVIIFRISVTSGLLDVFILFSQLISFPAMLRSKLFHHSKVAKSLGVPGLILISMHGIWNLDFFRLLYPPFCINSKMTTLQTLALDYAIAVYPLLLIIITYSLIELHDHNFKLVVWLWKPFHYCFVCFRREWNIKNSLIDAFCTFLLLSYSKFLSVSFDLLVPVSVFDIHGETIKKYYLFFDGSVEYFGPEHLPFGILALAVFLVFNILPLVLLCLYPCRCFQRCLNYCGIRYQALHIFMDSFQGCYKNGANSTCDCRWFAALYLLLRITIIVMCGVVSINDFMIPLITFLFLLLFFLLTAFQPYKCSSHNTINSALIFVISLFLVSSMADIIAYETSAIPRHFNSILKPIDVFTGILSVIPTLYVIGLLVYKCFGHRSCTQRVCQRICASMPYGICRRMVHSGSEESLPDRVIHAEQYEVLLAEPVAENEESESMYD